MKPSLSTTRTAYTLPGDMLRNQAARAVLAALGVTCTLAAVALIVGGTTTYAERSDALFGLGVGFALIVVVSRLIPLVRRATDRQLQMAAIVTLAILAIPCAYAVLATLDAVPAAPWSPLG